MTKFPEKLRLKEIAEEDIYFARRDRELIQALHRKPLPLKQVCCGGQTGVDRGTLDAVLALSTRIGINAGGWCPRGRLAEDGVINARYPLDETPDEDPAQRTQWNVRDTDATLILHQAELSGGTLLTQKVAARLEKPLLLVDLNQPFSIDEICTWLRSHAVRVLNVAGPRESERPGIAAQSGELINRLLIAAKQDKSDDKTESSAERGLQSST